MSASMNSLVENFLDSYVQSDEHDAARTEMQEIFASMNAELAREMFKNFKGTKVTDSDSDSEEKPKKKRAPRKKKDDVEKVERPICTGLTAAGKPCKNKSSENEELCHVHLKKKNEPPKVKEPKVKKTKEPKAKKAKKTKKTPEHNHELTEESTEDCDLCDSHGNKATEGFEEEFELDGDTQSTLQAILNKASDSEEDSEEEDMKFLRESEENAWPEQEQEQEKNLDMPDLDELGLDADSPPKTRSKSRPVPKSMRTGGK